MYERMARKNGIKDNEMQPTLDAIRKIIQVLPDVNAEIMQEVVD